jgi:hypothetical protein
MDSIKQRDQNKPKGNQHTHSNHHPSLGQRVMEAPEGLMYTQGQPNRMLFPQLVELGST